jgi:di/tricarboxylate transporter
MLYFIVMGVVISLLLLLLAWTLFRAAGKEPPDNPNRPP